MPGILIKLMCKPWLLGVTLGVLIIGTPIGFAAYQDAHKFDGVSQYSDSKATNTPENTTNPESSKRDTSTASTPASRGTQNSKNATSVTSGYTPGKCTDTVIPYKTSYKYNPQLPPSYRKVLYAGVNGTSHSCTPDSNGHNSSWTTQPYDQVVEVGTYTAPAPKPKDYSICNQFADSGAYQQCIDAINRQ